MMLSPNLTRKIMKSRRMVSCAVSSVSSVLLLRRNGYSNQWNSIVSQCLRNCVSKTDNKEKFFITTPIFYVNAQPHIGHAYSAVLADAAYRFKLLQGVYKESTLFSVGTDEHGLKIQQAAAAIGDEPLQFCDHVSEHFRSLFDQVNVGYTDFVRTVEERHKLAVEHFFSALVERGHIYKGNYSGWYSVSDEAFLTESQLREVTLPSGEKKFVSVESGHPVEWSTEDNYIFRLSSFQDDLQYWLKDEKRVQPKHFHNQLQKWLSEGLNDLSVSRPNSRVSWGIPVPGDNLHTIYVWVDALINYLTVAGYPNLNLWPPDVQVLGKDILRFHGIYWPALLLAVGLEPPRSLLCHYHFTVEGEKMSKSVGNVVCPQDCVKKFSVDGLRYCLLRGATTQSDSNWNEELKVRFLNAELANSLGNLMSRCTGLALNPHQLMPPLDPQYLKTMPLVGQQLVELLVDLPNSIEDHYQSFSFYHGVEVIMNAVHKGNALFNEEKPWELKNLPDRTKLDSVLRLCLETVRIAGLALQPIVPTLASQLLDSLGVPASHRYWANLKIQFDNSEGTELSKPSNLGSRIKFFPKIKL